MLLCVEWGGSPPPYIASPRVDPRLDLRGGTMHVRDGCRGAVGDCSRKLGLNKPNKGSAEPFLWPFGLIFGRCVPCGDYGVHSCRYVGLACHLGPKIHVRTACVCRKCLFSWAWANLLQDVGPLILVLARML